jgi:hypothetical protein
MSKFRRILPMAFFILAMSAMPLLADNGRDKRDDGRDKRDDGRDKRDDGRDKRDGVPEIDLSLASTALALLSGGVLILKSKSGVSA